jgi:cytochrome c biogenesis protein CcmG/thiol:disulfide interchange protein DsbE
MRPRPHSKENPAPRNDPPAADSRPPDKGSFIGTWGWLILAALVVIYLVVRSNEPADDSGANHHAVGTDLALLRLEPLTGTTEPVELGDLSGKVVLINYWGPWCYYCSLEFPQLMELQRRHADDPRFRFLSVSTSQQDPRDEDVEELAADTARYLAERKADFSTYRDANADSRMSLVATAKLNGFTYPMTVILDGKGTIRGLWEGYHEGDVVEMSTLLDPLLKK